MRRSPAASRPSGRPQKEELRHSSRMVAPEGLMSPPRLCELKAEMQRCPADSSRPLEMRRLLPLVCLALALEAQAFEFLINGEWEEESFPSDRSVMGPDDKDDGDFEAFAGSGIIVRSYKVESRITSRFAHTTVRSLVVNVAQQAESIAFNVQIPKRAFITNFTMNVNGVMFVGSVKEKTVARNLYAQARARGKAAGIVRTNAQDMDTFKMEVHVPANSNIEFELHYQEMMQRKLGFYEHSLYLQPGQLVPILQVDVYIYEPKGIAVVEAPNTLGEQFKNLAKVVTSKDKAHVAFRPTLFQQRKCDSCSTTAVDGIFTVRYDVHRDNSAGELQVSDGHFVHFFAPNNLSSMPKNIVFVIDVSGSMWGIKMKQMVEALQTILDDLTIDDHFSIIDFNHHVRCWSEDLVHGSSTQVADAKKYIQSIKPSGGTNINEALMRAIHMLNKAANQGFIDQRSVSMIIFVSDGDPTIGEIKLSAIQKNVKRYIREEFSLFSLGIGFDVDFDFLERISMENRGIAQRIYARHDTSEQLRISSPLLRKVTIQFPEDSVSNVTQNHFDKFFSGSELVVAGKVQTCFSSPLISFVTASSAQMDLSLQTETDCTELDSLLGHQSHSVAGFARQMWAYITINQLLAERSLAKTAAEKRKITRKILKLALEHQFVTPFTAMLVESETGQERLLADSPKDPKHGCCIVENDPHFTVHLPKSHMDVCFNIDSEPGHILNLVSDPESVNGQLVAGKKIKNNKLNTYFGTISIYYKTSGIRVDVSTQQVNLIHGKDQHSFSWASTANITLSGNNIYSTRVHGLIGQFAVEPEVKIYNIHDGADPVKQEATMEVKGNKLAVTRGWQKDYRKDRKYGSNVFCWFVHNNGKGFIDGQYKNYIVPQMDTPPAA
ncbi:inter-alpha-trypsin inhibitor heavy chain H2-like [Scleropages formosus]|uniref:Inter-alpha-trypsin inhibitor heavy chain H2-like n=1 Tax=Scleropages formosus TaxID=113540 RepID=A0A0P7Z376_SCLFO|nr:inter-alpha-trypsin inhibitor heavy chain H2-like [Scleropages formosus]